MNPIRLNEKACKVIEKGLAELDVQAAVNPTLAESIAKAVYSYNPNLILYELANSKLVRVKKSDF
jgi:lactam utilization protein B